MPEAAKQEQKYIITDRQARSLIKLMDMFYSDPKNVTAFEKWKSEREKGETNGTDSKY